MKIYESQETPEVVYFLSCTDGTVKIGTTKDYPARISQVLKENHKTLKDCFCIEGDYKVERIFLDMFAKNRIEGEWFNLNFNKVKKQVSNTYFDYAEYRKNKEESMRGVEAFTTAVKDFVMCRRKTESDMTTRHSAGFQISDEAIDYLIELLLELKTIRADTKRFTEEGDRLEEENHRLDAIISDKNLVISELKSKTVK